MKLTDNIQTLKNVGEQRLAKLNHLGIFTVSDLIEHFPRDYMDRSDIKKIGDLYNGETATIKATLAATPENIRYGAKNITKIKLSDGTGILEAVWFNQPYMKSALKPKSEYLFSGKAIAKGAKCSMESPEFEAVSDKELLSSGRIVPVYPSTEGISQKMFRALIKDALDNTSSQITDFMPPALLQKFKLCERKFAVCNLHFPASDAFFFEARKRLVFEELFVMQTALLKMRGYIQNKQGFLFRDTGAAELLDLMPFRLTNAQNSVLKEIQNDLQSGFVMNRLIQGDVGSGKTAVAMIACWLAVKNGFQASLMAPTETLAVQHYHSFTEIFSKLGVTVRLLSGSLKKREKDEIKAELAAGHIDILLGTHAIIQDNVVFNCLGLVITDEQHRFGVRQRATLTDKGVNPHVLVMTATPIPRTLAMILYGDMDISIINELPPGRQKIDTSAVNSSYHERIYTFIKKQIDEGRQVYIICSLIQEGQEPETLDAIEGREPAETAPKNLKAVIEFAEDLRKNTFSGYRLAVLHGKMKQSGKNEIMSEFGAGNIDILVSTTVIEVGINVPNASVMLIENAERFGLSQLHQLRGRVGRGSEKSYCILVTDSKSQVTKKRMKAMTSTNDGFVLSELDLELRGPGEFFGTLQHGIPELHLANLYKDMDVMKEAQNAVRTMLEADPALIQPENAPLRIEIEKILANTEKISL